MTRPEFEDDLRPASELIVRRDAVRRRVVAVYAKVASFILVDPAVSPFRARNAARDRAGASRHSHRIVFRRSDATNGKRCAAQIVFEIGDEGRLLTVRA